MKISGVQFSTHCVRLVKMSYAICSGNGLWDFNQHQCPCNLGRKKCQIRDISANLDNSLAVLIANQRAKFLYHYYHHTKMLEQTFLRIWKKMLDKKIMMLLEMVSSFSQNEFHTLVIRWVQLYSAISKYRVTGVWSRLRSRIKLRTRSNLVTQEKVDCKQSF